MKIETILTPAELPALAQRDLRATACVVFDVLRATSTFVAALQNGAKKIIPVSEISEAVAFKNSKLKIKNSKSILLGGERNGVRISSNGINFDLGNSPREFLPVKVRGKIIVSTTTNGTRALRACAKAKIVLASSFLNLSATAKFLEQKNFPDLLLICAGTGEEIADEDVLAAGALIELLVEPARAETPSDQAARGEVNLIISDSSQIARQSFHDAKSDLLSAFAKTKNGARLLAIPELREDVAFCAQRDIFNLVAAMDADGALRRISV